MDLEAQVKDLKDLLEKERNKFQKEIAELHAYYRAIIISLKDQSDVMKDLFLKELLIKDNIIKSTEGAKDKYYQIARYLKT